MLEHNNKKGFKWNLFKTYIFIWGIPFLVSVILSIFIITDLHNTIRNSDEVFLNMIRNKIDADLEQQSMLYTQIALNKDIDSLRKSKDSKIERQKLARKGYEQLKSMAFSNDITENIILFFHDSDLSISANGISDCKLTYQINFDEGSYEEWVDQIGDCSWGKYKLMSFKVGTETEKRIAYLRSMPATGIANIDRVTVVIIMKNTFFNTFDQVLRTENRKVSITDGKQELTLRTLGEYSYSNKEMTISTIESRLSDWEYVVYTPKGEYWKMLYRAYISIIIVVLVTLIAGLILIYYSTKKNYSPIKRLVEYIKINNVSGEKTEDEFEYLYFAIENILKSEQKNLNRINNQDIELHKNFMGKMLKNGIAVSEDSLLKMGLDISNNGFVIVLFEIINDDLLFPEDNISYNQQYKLSRFITENIMEELIGERYQGCFFEIDNLKVGIISVTEDYAAVTEFLKSSMETGIYAIEEKFDFTVKCAISNIYTDVSKLHLGYLEAKDVIGYMDLFDIYGIELYQNISKHSDVSPGYCATVETRLINYITNGCFEQAKEVLRELFNVNPNVSQTEIQFILLGLAGTLVKLLSEKKEPFSEKYTRLIKETVSIFNEGSIEEKEETLTTIIGELCKWRQEEVKTESQVVTKIMEYVADYYSDVNLNIQQLGEKLGITAYYASKQFKDYTGERLMDYIYRVRVQKAKELMSETNYKLKDIAVLVGLNDTRSLNVVFKRVEGVAPSTYKAGLK